MAQKPLSEKVMQETVDMVAELGSFERAAIALGIPSPTLHSRHKRAILCGYRHSPKDKPTGTFDIPKSRATEIKDVLITNMSKALVISDVHIPYHNTRALEIALEYGQKNGADGIIINGDLIDLAPLSDHETIPARRQTLGEDIKDTTDFLLMLRKEFPKASLIWHEGNHERRAPRYFIKRAPEVYGPIMGEEGDWIARKTLFQGQWVRNSQTMILGKLNIIHGNQYRGGGIMAARTIFLRALDNVLSSDKHRTQEYIDRRIQGQIIGSWITGHLSEERPEWLSHNRWNLGFAFVEVDTDGGFLVRNLKIINGKLR